MNTYQVTEVSGRRTVEVEANTERSARLRACVILDIPFSRTIAFPDNQPQTTEI